ncbi:ribonuclease H-like domain-containing protein [Tanacetum coccineum]
MSGPDTTVELLVKLLGLLGLSDHSNLSSSNTNASKSNFVSHDNPTVYHTSIGPGPHNYVPTAPSPGPIPYYTLPAQPQGPIALPVQYHRDLRDKRLLYPHAFAAGTLHDPTTDAWNMDTGASSHLNNSVTSLSTNFNSCMYPSVSVGDGYSIPVTNTGHCILPTPTRSLHLNNVLITPHIVKNLIYVRQFVRDNNCPIEFNAFGFSVKDFMTRRVLLRCDSTGDHYPVTSPSPIHHAFLVSQHTWHQRLGHLGGEVLRRLVSSNFISSNKEKPPILCHACQLGKHVKLPFVSSDTVISSCLTLFTRMCGLHPFRVFQVLNIIVVIAPICLDLHTNKIIISRHVTFDETVFPYGSTIPKSTSPYTFLEDTFDLHPTLPNPAFTTPTIGQTDPLPHQQHPTEPAAQQSPTAAPPTPASPSTAQIHSPVQQPSPMAQHTPIQLQFSPTTVSHQTTIVSDQHAPAIIQNPPVNPNPDSVHPMVTRFRVGTNRPTERLNLHVSSVSPLPKSYRDAFNDPNWQNAMRDEYTALIKNKTWTLVPRPPDTNIVRCMWLFRHKYLADGTLSRYKARLVANGSTQLEGVDVDETFSPVVKPGTIRTVLSLAASRHWPIHQLDVKNAFLHGDLSETVYMHQPPGFRDSAHPDYVCLLQRSLYGLKQAPRAWFQRFASYITRTGFSHSRCDSSLFIYRQGIDTAYLLLYVDDIVLTASSEGLLQQIIGSLHQEFAMTDLGPLNYFLGISVTRDSSGLFLSQKKYAIEILEKAHMVSCNHSRTPVDTESKLGVDGDPVSDLTLYRSLAGSLQYLTFT